MQGVWFLCRVDSQWLLEVSNSKQGDGVLLYHSAEISLWLFMDFVVVVARQLHPPIVVLEDVYECKDLEQLLVAAGSLSRRPYIIAALSSGTTKGIPLHQLLFHHQIRSVGVVLLW